MNERGRRHGGRFFRYIGHDSPRLCRRSPSFLEGRGEEGTGVGNGVGAGTPGRPWRPDCRDIGPSQGTLVLPLARWVQDPAGGVAGRSGVRRSMKTTTERSAERAHDIESAGVEVSCRLNTRREHRKPMRCNPKAGHDTNPPFLSAESLSRSAAMKNPGKLRGSA